MKKSALILLISFCIALSSMFGIGGGIVAYYLIKEYDEDSANEDAKDLRDAITNSVEVVNEESAIIKVAQEASEAVVSIVITAEVPKYEYYDPFAEDPFFEGFSLPQLRQNGTEEREVGSGSGFIISKDGTIITNKHVVELEDASYTVIFNDGSTAEAEVLARDTVLDIAFIKVDKDNLKPLDLGSSDNLKVGQTVVAIGNALGEFNNSVSSGIISGLKRNIIASDQTGQFRELLADVIQTDASINPGNSGGPLLDIEGNVIGVNVAVAQSGENVGFAIPINMVIDLLDRLDKNGNIERPVLGVRYILINDSNKESLGVDISYGALVQKGPNNEPAIVPKSPADEAGIAEGDIILEVEGEKIEGDITLQRLIQERYIDDVVELKILRDGKEIEVDVELFKFSI